MRNFLSHKLAACQRGAAAIEFAIVAWGLLFMITAILELGLIFFTSSVLEGSTNVGSRIGKTGFAPDGTEREAHIRSEVERLSSGFLNPADIQLTILSYNSFGEVGQPEDCLTANCNAPGAVAGVDYVDANGDGAYSLDRGVAGVGGNGQIVLYQVTYPWHVFTPYLATLLGVGETGLLNISAVATVRNEPF